MKNILNVDKMCPEDYNTRPVIFETSGFATEFFTHLIRTWYRYLKEHTQMGTIWIGYQNQIKKITVEIS